MVRKSASQGRIRAGPRGHEGHEGHERSSRDFLPLCHSLVRGSGFVVDSRFLQMECDVGVLVQEHQKRRTCLARS